MSSSEGLRGMWTEAPPRLFLENRILETLELVTNQMAVAVSWCSRDLRYIWASEEYARWIRRPMDQIVGRPIIEVVGAEAFEALRCYIDRVLTGERVHYERETDFQGIGKRWTMATYTPTLEANGVISGWVAVVIDITERKRAEEALRKSEERFRSAAQAGKMFAYEWDAASDKVVRSGDCSHVLGMTEIAPLTGEEIFAKVHPEDRERLTSAIAQLSPQRPYLQIKYRMLRTDGGIVWVERTSQAYFDDNGKLLRIAGMVADVTERKRTEDEVKKSEQRFRLAAQAGKMYSFEWDVMKDSVERSPEHVEVLDVKEPLRITHREFMDKIHPDDRPKLIAAIASLNPENPTCNVSYRLSVSDSPIVWIKSNGRALFDEEGRMLRLVGMAADITDQKLAEEALRLSEERLRLAQHVAQIGSFERNIRTGVNTWTPEMELMYGLKPGEFGRTRTAFEDLIHPDDRAGVIKLVDGALRTGQPTKGEWRVIWPDASVHWITGRWQVLMDDSGEPSRVVGVNLDITERKQAEEELQESEERFRLVANAAPVMIWMSGPDKKPNYFNQLWLDFTGLSETDLQNGLAGIVHPDDYQQCHASYCHGFDQRQAFRKECRLRRRDGEYRWILDIGVPRFHKDGSFAGYIGCCIDVTDRKLAEDALAGMSRKLIEAQERERARIARELHDDINQRLAMLAVQLEQLHDKSSDTGTRVEEIRKGITEISNDVQALSHDLHSSQLEYLGVVAGMKSWSREFGQRQGIQIDYTHEVLNAVPNETGLCLFRVLQEALHNAAKHSGAKRIEVQMYEESGEIHLSIKDLGKGFDIDEVRQSRGLGLTSMQERVRLVNGTIEIQSRPMGGTTIDVRVPVDPKYRSRQSDLPRTA